VTRPSPQDWIALATAPHQLIAEIWQRVLEDEGVTVRLEAADAVSFLGVSPFPCRIMVRRGDYQAAKAALNDIMAGASLAEEMPQDEPPSAP